MMRADLEEYIRKVEDDGYRGRKRLLARIELLENELKKKVPPPPRVQKEEPGNEKKTASTSLRLDNLETAIKKVFQAIKSPPPRRKDTSVNEARLVELERRTRKLQVQFLEAIDEAEGTFELLWQGWITPVWKCLTEIQDKISASSVIDEKLWTFDLVRVQERVIQAALKQFNGNKMRSARALNINIKTLYLWLHRMEERENEAASKKKAPNFLRGDNRGEDETVLTEEDNGLVL